ncbi:MAG: cbb3-type cytochrome oxidase assembly protein CcoS [Burkholderiales bacterium]|jgi:cbb3-type cytochrome oxidase maturation protein|nr:cbb3-type cytochrome oxidase assembly protein CcoS [Burkholderiales bacterium]
MDSLYLLIPLSVVLVMGIGVVLVWSVMSGQFDALEGEGQRILDETSAQDGADAGSKVDVPR